MTNVSHLNVSLRPFDQDSDLSLLTVWLAKPHVRRRWGDPQRNLAAVRERGNSTSHCIVTANGTSVGYACWAALTAQDFADVGVLLTDDATMDIDLLIGDASCVGKGVGTEALRQLLTRLAAEPGLERASVFTACDNRIAQRAFEKAGFTKVTRYPDSEFGMSWVMIAPLHGR